eukprot:3773920-Amphidinium_carterae.1
MHDAMKDPISYLTRKLDALAQSKADVMLKQQTRQSLSSNDDDNNSNNDDHQKQGKTIISSAELQVE